MSDRVYQQSRDGGHWHPIDVLPQSVIARALATLKARQPYEYCPGWRYRWTRP